MRVTRTRFSKRRSKRKTEFPIVAVVQKKRKSEYPQSLYFSKLPNKLDLSEQLKNGVAQGASGEEARLWPFAKLKQESNLSQLSRKKESSRPQRKSRATIDYKNVILLRNLITAEGKILPRRISKLTAKQQRHVQKAIKSARIMGLIPFINKSRPF